MDSIWAFDRVLLPGLHPLRAVCRVTPPSLYLGIIGRRYNIKRVLISAAGPWSPIPNKAPPGFTDSRLAPVVRRLTHKPLSSLPPLNSPITKNSAAATSTSENVTSCPLTKSIGSFCSRQFHCPTGLIAPIPSIFPSGYPNIWLSKDCVGCTVLRQIPNSYC